MLTTVRQFLFSSIRRQVIALLSLTALVYAGLHWQIEKHLLLPQFVLLQETEAKQDMQRIKSLIDHEITSVSQKVADWAAWDDTYEYVLDHNTEYEESNLLLESLIHMQISMLAIFDLEGKMVWGQGCDWRQEEPLALNLLAPKHLPPSHPLLQHQSADDSINSILLCPEGPMIISSMPIVTSERTGPNHGTLMMGRFLDSACTDQWSQELSISFSLENWDSLPTTPTNLEIRPKMCQDQTLLRYDTNHITAYQPLPDLEGHNTLFIQAQIPSSILSRGTAAIRFSTISIFIVGGLLLLTLYAILHWTLLGRLRHFSQHFHDVSKKRDLSKRIQVSQADEMSLLQTSFNSMLHNLEQSDRALRDGEETYRQIFNSVHDSLCVLNTNGRLIAVNPSACETFGLTQQDLEGRSMHLLIHPDAHSTLNHLIKTALASGQSSEEISFVCHNGNTIEVTALGRSTRMLGQTCVLMVLRDIHERREIQSSLQQARQDAQNAHEFKSGLLRNVTHEMRSPLNHIIGFCTLLSEEQLCAAHQEYLDHIRQSSEELMSLVNSIIDISRIESGSLSLNFESHSLTALLHEIEMIGRSKAEKQGLSFRLNPQPPLPETFITDNQRLLQCLKVLIDNAIKFTPSGTVEINIYSHTKNPNDYLCFDICDNGPGISEQAQEDIFNSFAQVDASATRTHGGMGTGLAITKGLLEYLGGSISVQSTPGQGSVFTISLSLNTTANRVRLQC